ncbi:MAG: phenylalanine--tRNA ligase beta subunit-related protein [Anaerolineaceae bacterium]|nr:phenylalanine--tRNA ligase beta subunit-related protein [Anaerolineaceae bacterium]
MRYSVDTSVFEINPDIKFGVLIGKNIKNSATMPDDEDRLREAEKRMRENYQADQVRELLNVSLYRDFMTNAGINPNRFPPSVEAMFKRILKGGALPVINALVDLCNAVSIEQMISLGAHDLNDIQEDLEVRFGKEGDLFLPFGAAEYEAVDKGELVFASGNVVQTRKWIWRQSELGKTTIDSKEIFFQLVGFDDDKGAALNKAMEDIERLVTDRFRGSCEKYIVDLNHRTIDF